MNILDKLRPVALLQLRGALGVIFVYYGWGKLFSEAESSAQFFRQHALPAYASYVTGIVELFGGCLLIVGLFTRISALLLTAIMAGALWKVGFVNGVLAVPQYQLPMAVGVGVFALAAFGAGVISLDYAIFRQKA